MAQFSYSFCMAMLHSLWQAGLLMLLYLVADKVFLRNNPPLAKRNFLFIILFSQALLFVLSFFIYFTGNNAHSSFSQMGDTILSFAGSANTRMITTWVFSIYIAVFTYKLIRAVYLWINFKQQYRSGLQRPTADLKVFMEMKSYQFGIKRKVKLWLSSTVNTPVTFGFFKPVILLPIALVNNISSEQAETLILHELTHIRTNDYLFNWLLLFIENIFFYNPFVTGLCNKVRMEREKNCDINVMLFEYSPALYAETLLQAERIKQMVPAFQLAAVNRKKQLLSRIHFFSGNSVSDRPGRFNIIVPFAGLLLLFFLSSILIFQSSGKRSSASATAVTMPYIPFSSDELSNTTFVNSTSFSANNLKKLAEETEKQKPVVENAVKQLNPVIESIQKKTETLSKDIEQNFSVVPVAAKENDAARQIIIKEEGSGKASVKVYYLIFENGQWILKPVWTLAAKEISDDAIRRRMDSSSDSITRIIPPQQ